MGRVVCARERVSEFIEIQEGSFNTQFQQRSTLPWLPSTVPRGCAFEKHNGIAEAMISVEGDSQGRRQREKEENYYSADIPVGQKYIHDGRQVLEWTLVSVGTVCHFFHLSGRSFR